MERDINFEIKELIYKKYNISAKYIEKIKGVYRIQCDESIYCLKVVKYELSHFLFILGAMNHLRDRGFSSIPEIIKTTEGCDYIKFFDYYAYLSPWLKGRECSYDNLIELYMAARKLGELHNASEGFNVSKDMKPRVGWFKWIEVFRTRKSEIIDFKYRISEKTEKTEVDLKYLAMMPEELDRCDRAIDNLCNSRYDVKMLEDIRNGGFCHHDYAHHNVMVCKDGINVIDFDYCILDTYLHDLSSLILRAMKYGRWDIERTKIILRAYNTVHKLSEEDIDIMASFMEFPQDFWQRGIQYYWEKQPWDDGFYLRKLMLYDEDKNEKQNFLYEFRNINLNNILGGKS